MMIFPARSAAKKEPPLTRGVSVACLCVEERLIVVIQWHGIRLGHPAYPNPCFLRIPSVLRFTLGASFGPVWCYISNGRAKACGTAIDMTCCIWDVVQV